ncbi:MAG: chemotaxis response regulator protein-glutamate methylesterase [Alphaproteobacteria bacterium]|nr:MAG: chemotaxis response regulator protein-glutamate methylesterase [Alphaproteobacteria bacterium]
MPDAAKRVTVLIVDDSALIRRVLTELLGSDSRLQVLGAAPDPLVARQMIKALNPDVITLDVEMPKMDGLVFLERLMTLRPMPVVMVSSLTEAGAEATVRALELGAVDYLEKPKLGLSEGMALQREALVEKVLAAARARIRPLGQRPRPQPLAPTGDSGVRSTEMVVAIGASTGGVEALREVITALPPDAPATLIAQHMPGRFTATFAARLNGLSAVRVAEATAGERVLPGHVYIAPGTHHLRLKRSGANYVCHLDDGPLVSGHRPSVDVLFRSVAESAGSRAIGVILTGMGRDGAEGLLTLRTAGAYTIGESETTAMIYGMPKAAKQLGAVTSEVPLDRVAAEILLQARTPRVRI